MSSSLFPAPGPSLPLFDSLLVKGPYPPSAPIHLCISHLQANAGKALFLTPNRQALAAPLQDFNDEWLTTNAAKGLYLTLLSRIDIYCPPTTAHWLLLLSLFKPLSSSSTGPGPGPGSSSPPNKAVLPHTPSLIVLHEPSAYFTPADAAFPPDLSRYLQLITTALSTASFLSPLMDKPIPVVLFDSHLGDLRLPIVRPPTPSRRLFASRQESPTRQDRVVAFVEKYFTWIGTVIDEPAEQNSKINIIPTTPPRSPRSPQPPAHGTFEAITKERSGSFRLRLDRRVPVDGDYHENQMTIEWSEVTGDRKPHSSIRETRFVFHSDE